MEVSDSAEGADSPTTTRPKRSRTGCLTCRTRRRKCDEGKPICQNCIAKSLDCRYAAAFQILGKNSFTAGVQSSVKYGNVRFVGDEDQQPVENNEERLVIKTGKNTESSPSLASPDVSIPLGAEKHLPGIERRPQATELQNVASHTPSPNSYEFALHGLLALGSGNSINDGLAFPPLEEPREQPMTSAFNSVSMLDSQTALVSQEISQEMIGVARVSEDWQSTSRAQAQLGGNAHGKSATARSPHAPTPESESNPIKHALATIRASKSARTHQTSISKHSTSGWADTPNAVPQDFALELLKHYRYHIAPWLDICDSHQCFGVEVLALSAEKTSFRYQVLALANAALNGNQMSQIQEIADHNRKTIAQQEVVQCAVLDVFRILRNVVTDLSNFWLQEEEVGKGKQVLETLLPQLGSDSALASSTYWLLVRLVLSCALMATTPVRIPLPFVAHNLFRSTGNGSIARCAQDAIALCVDAIMFSQGDEDRWLQQRYGLNRVEVWETLIQGFVHWYMHRSLEFQPIIELYPKDGVRSDNDFPTIVFTGGAAILANQLYHTGMLLLLQNKPRFADKPNSTSSSMSTLWHAHRICGIAIQNDGPESWDPCLVASLIVAARTVTHGSQHAAIVYALETVQRLTGWNISRYTDELRSEWQLAEGW